MSQKWSAGIYGIYKAPVIEYVNGRRAHSFRCLGKNGNCSRVIRRYLDTTDAVSTSNMHKHAKKCWGLEVVEQVDAMASIEDVRQAFVRKTLSNGDIKVLLEKGKSKIVSYSNRNFTEDQTRYVT